MGFVGSASVTSLARATIVAGSALDSEGAHQSDQGIFDKAEGTGGRTTESDRKRGDA